MIGLQRKHLPPGLGTAIGKARTLYPGLIAGIDVLNWVPAFFVAGLVRAELGAVNVSWPRIAAVTGMGMFAFLVAAIAAQLYTNRWQTATFEEVVGLGIAWLPGAGVAFLANAVLLSPRVPTSIVGFGAALALMLSLAARAAWRFARDAMNRPDPKGRTRVLVYGAGAAGTAMVQSMQSNRDSTHVAVAILDDDPLKRQRVVHGVPVLGDRTDIGKLAGQTDMVVIAIPSATPETINEITELARQAELDVRVLPAVGEMFGLLAGPSIEHARPVEVTDLLGRDEVTIDRDAVAAYLRDKRVLVTGAGGSIGSELCRQLHAFEPAELIMVDRDETALQEVQLSIAGHGLLNDPGLVLANIRDAERVDELFRKRRPQIVFHAAALKHLPLLEAHPREGLLTNICGTGNLLRASADQAVELFVNVSTDKAATPSSVLGTTKRFAEMLTSAIGIDHPGRFVSVRFGNVLASRGSVVPTFERQIASGGPVTVTHRDATRYFMTIPEAVRLILQSGALGDSGELLVLDMGEPMKILDLAEKLIRHHQSDAEITFTGLRPNEKLHEVLSNDDEDLRKGAHSRIMHTRPSAPAVTELHAAIDRLLSCSPDDLAAALMTECNEASPTASPDDTSAARSAAG